MGDQPNRGVKVLLYGAGSIGGVYLYQLLQAGCHVTAVCRSNYDTVSKDGFRLASVRYGDVNYHPSALVRDITECKDQQFDFVLVCTKSFPGSTPSLPDQLRPVLEGRPKTAIVMAQNGIMIEEEVRHAFPHNPIISGVIYLPAVQTRPGVIEYPEMLNLLELGTYPSDAEESHKTAARHLADLMIKGGGNAEVHEDIQVARWCKLLMNAAWNPICALTLTTDGDFLRTSGPHALDLVWGIMMEIIEVAKAVGVAGVTVEEAEKKLAIGKRRAEMGTGREMSMLQDVRQGRAFEVEAILGNVSRLGKQKGVPLPRVDSMYALAKARSWALVSESSQKTN